MAGMLAGIPATSVNSPAAGGKEREREGGRVRDEGRTRRAGTGGVGAYGEGMDGIRYEFETSLFRWAARRELWVFARLPDEIADEIRDMPLRRGGFDSVKIIATLGSSRWSTSIFPEPDGGYVLAVKKVIRVREGVDLGDRVRIAIEPVV